MRGKGIRQIVVSVALYKRRENKCELIYVLTEIETFKPLKEPSDLLPPKFG